MLGNAVDGSLTLDMDGNLCVLERHVGKSASLMLYNALTGNSTTSPIAPPSPLCHPKLITTL